MGNGDGKGGKGRGYRKRCLLREAEGVDAPQMKGINTPVCRCEVLHDFAQTRQNKRLRAASVR